MPARWIPGLLLAALLLAAAPALFASDQAVPQPPGTDEINLAALLGSPGSAPAASPVKPAKPAWIPASCYEEVYNYCQWACYDLSQNGGCDFFANQACLCMYYPADCPVCY